MVQDIDTGTPNLIASMDGPIGSIVLNNPKRHNAISGEMFAGFGDAATAFAANPDLRVVVMSGAGDKAFASGADIGGLSDRTSRPSGLPALAELGLPVVAKIKGYCIGGGLMTALYADLRIAADDAVLGIPAAKLGVGYPLDATDMLVATVGEPRAKEILLVGDRFGADRAHELGLLHRVVPAGDLDTVVDELVATLADNAPLSMAASKAAVASANGRCDVSEAQSAISRTFGSDDFAEGRAAFGERRTPKFSGR